MSNVTPIKPPGPPQPPRRRARRRGIRFEDAPEDGPSTLRLVQALHGVCTAMEALHIEGPPPTVEALDLATAAAILSEELQRRITTD
jgi:hypothetical protein